MKRQAFLPDGHAIRCILFDLGYTLWDRRRNPQLWSDVEAVSNRHAVSVLRSRVPSKVLPEADDDRLGERLRESFDEHEHDMIRRDPTCEPDGALAVVRTLQDWGFDLGSSDYHLGTPGTTHKFRWRRQLVAVEESPDADGRQVAVATGSALMLPGRAAALAEPAAIPD